MIVPVRWTSAKSPIETDIPLLLPITRDFKPSGIFSGSLIRLDDRPLDRIDLQGTRYKCFGLADF